MIPLHALQLIKFIRSENKNLSRTESGFISSVYVQAQSNRLLTYKQAKWLNDIYAKVSGGGTRQDREIIK